NYLGADVTGTATVPNAIGVWIEGAGNTVRGTTGAARNVISGNTRSDGNGIGVNIVGAGATGNIVAGNYIGTDYTGSVAVPNDNGVAVGANQGANIPDASNNTIGGPTPEARNVVSGNSYQGIYIGGTGTTGNLVQGNYVGTNADGTAAIRSDTVIAGI